jgi:hypothetical protein
MHGDYCNHTLYHSIPGKSKGANPAILLCEAGNATRAIVKSHSLQSATQHMPKNALAFAEMAGRSHRHVVLMDHKGSGMV